MLHSSKPDSQNQAIKFHLKGSLIQYKETYEQLSICSNIHHAFKYSPSKLPHVLHGFAILFKLFCRHVFTGQTWVSASAFILNSILNLCNYKSFSRTQIKPLLSLQLYSVLKYVKSFQKPLQQKKFQCSGMRFVANRDCVQAIDRK